MPIYNQRAETMPRAELEQLQLERLQTTLNRVYRHVAFYRHLFDQQHLEVSQVRSLEALRDFPFTTRDDLRRSYPYDLFAVPLREIVRVHTTSGTTGKPVGVGYTQNDLRHWSELTARVLYAANVTERDFIQIAFDHLSVGTFGFHEGAERIRAGMIPVPRPDVHDQLRIMRDFKTTALVSTPTYARRISLVIEEMGIRPQELSLTTAVLGGEPWSEDLRRDLESGLSVKAYDNYGLTEIMGPGVAAECECREGLHVYEDYFLLEVVDPQTLAPRAPGETGELVFTTLAKDGFPLVRYRTGDLGAVIPGPCRCGRTLTRMTRVSGRCDDLLIVGGVKFLPQQLEELLAECPGLEPCGELIIECHGADEVLELRAEVTPGFPSLDEIKGLQELRRRFTDRVAQGLGLPLKITLVEHGSLPRPGGKRRIRVTDRRPR